jgi:hypothetical protein
VVMEREQRKVLVKGGQRKVLVEGSRKKGGGLGSRGRCWLRGAEKGGG